MTAVATATSLPIAFQGITVKDDQDPKYVARFLDAGLIDNLAMMPLLQILRHDESGKSIGPVKQWILSDAGKPLSVTSRTSSLYALGNTRLVGSLGLFDRIFRLTGDLAQPQFVNLIAKILTDYANIHFVAIAIGPSLEDDEPWISTANGEPTPSQMPTTLGFVPKHLALSVMTEGAQAMSKALVYAELMTVQKQQEVKEFFAELAR